MGSTCINMKDGHATHVLWAIFRFKVDGFDDFTIAWNSQVRSGQTRSNFKAVSSGSKGYLSDAESFGEFDGVLIFALADIERHQIKFENVTLTILSIYSRHSGNKCKYIEPKYGFGWQAHFCSISRVFQI